MKKDDFDISQYSDGAISAFEILTKADSYRDKGFDIIELLPKQKKAIEILTDNTHKELLFGGAAGGSKSWLGCEWLLWECLANPNTKWFIGRAELKRILQSTYQTFLKVCRKHGVKSGVDFKMNGQYNYIEFTNGSRIDFLDLKYQPRDPMYERFGSLEYTGGWIEEGGEVDFGAYDVLKTRIGRHMNGELGIIPKLLITCNPKKNWMYYEFYQKFKTGTLEANKAFIQAFATDNSYLTDDYLDNLRNTKDVSKYQRLWLGNWEYEIDPTILIDAPAIGASFDNSVAPDFDNRFITGDIAGYGSDLFVVLVWYGWFIAEVFVMEKSGGQDVMNEINRLKLKHNIINSNCIFDSDGIGGLVAGETGIIAGSKRFVNNSKPLWVKKQNFNNLKSFCAYKLAEKMNSNGVNFYVLYSTKYWQRVVREFEQLRGKYIDDDGKTWGIISKAEMKKQLGFSPDFLDALLMRIWFEYSPTAGKIQDPIVGGYNKY